jgi:hypothetical protein
MQSLANKTQSDYYFANGSKGLDINRVSLWTPTELSTLLWLDGADSSTITLATGVSQWNDKSGNARHLIQANAGNQPLYNNNTVEFDSTKSLAISSVQVFSGATSGSVYFIGWQPTATSGGWGRFGGTGGGNLHTPFVNDGSFYESFMATGRVQIGGGVTYPLPESILCFENDGTNLTIIRNTSSVASVAITFSVPTTGNQFLGGMAGTFNIKEVVMFNSILSTTNKQKMEGYLAWKWNLVSLLPADHPYKNAIPTV